MMLHPMAREHPCRSIITMNRQRHSHGALRILDPGAIVLRDLQIIRNQIELLAGHVKRRMIVNLHARTIAEPMPNSIGAERGSVTSSGSPQYARAAGHRPALRGSAVGRIRPHLRPFAPLSEHSFPFFRDFLPISSFARKGDPSRMETTLLPRTGEQPQKIAVDWTESEWFQVWLRLAKRDYQGDASADQMSPSWVTYAAAA